MPVCLATNQARQHRLKRPGALNVSGPMRSMLPGEAKQWLFSFLYNKCFKRIFKFRKILICVPFPNAAEWVVIACSICGKKTFINTFAGTIFQRKKDVLGKLSQCYRGQHCVSHCKSSPAQLSYSETKSLAKILFSSFTGNIIICPVIDLVQRWLSWEWTYLCFGQC